MERFWFECPVCHETTCVNQDSVAGWENYECESCHVIIGVRLVVQQATIRPSGKIVPEQLESIGCQKIHWNPERNGGFFEYYVPVHGDGLDWRATRLSVTFNGFEKPEYDFMAWIVCPVGRFALFGVRTVELFSKMYELLTGAPWSEAAFQEKSP